jgi:hypothetical protein
VEETVESLKRALGEPRTWVIVATGRDEATFRARVAQLLQQKGCTPDELHLNPGMNTQRYKLNLLREVLDRVSGIREVEIWENHDDLLWSYVRLVGDHGLEVGGNLVQVDPMEVTVSDLRSDLIKLAYENEDLRPKLLPLLKQAAFSVEDGLRAKKLRLGDLAPKPGVKAGLRYFKKVRAWRIQQAFATLSGQIPDEKVQEFLRQKANGYGVDMKEDDRKKSWASDEEAIYHSLVDPRTSDMWKAMPVWISNYGGSAQDLGAEVDRLLRGKSDIQLMAAGMLSGAIQPYHTKKLLGYVRDHEGRSPEQLEALVAALKKV